MEEHERLLNFASAELDMAAGLPGFTPRFPPRPRPVVITGNTVLNNIKIANSQIGIVNTGTIGTIDNAVGLIRESGNQDVAKMLATMTEALANDAAIDRRTRDEALELLSAVATEAATPKEARRVTVARALLVDLSQILGGAGAAAQLWTM